MRIGSKGQVTIPIGIRERFGFLPGTEVKFLVQDDRVLLVRAGPRHGRGRSEAVIRDLRGSADVTLTTEEIMDFTRS